jgi:hypothetical protein
LRSPSLQLSTKLLPHRASISIRQSAIYRGPKSVWGPDGTYSCHYYLQSGWKPEGFHPGSRSCSRRTHSAGATTQYDSQPKPSPVATIAVTSTGRDCGKSFTIMFQLLSLLIVLAMAPTAMLAEERGHEPAHDNDLTGAWIVTNTAVGGKVSQFFWLSICSPVMGTGQGRRREMRPAAQLEAVALEYGSG